MLRKYLSSGLAAIFSASTGGGRIGAADPFSAAPAPHAVQITGGARVYL